MGPSDWGDGGLARPGLSRFSDLDSRTVGPLLLVHPISEVLETRCIKVPSPKKLSWTPTIFWMVGIRVAAEARVLRIDFSSLADPKPYWAHLAWNMGRTWRPAR